MKETQRKITHSKKGPGAAWAKLSWEDLNEWAGVHSVERGRSYQRQGRVHDLRLAEDGTLLAWVQGGERYAIRVQLASSGRISSECSCPVVWSCKHAVAAILESLDAINEARELPEATDDDRRLVVLKSFDACDLDDELQDDDDVFDEVDHEEVASKKAVAKRPGKDSTAPRRRRKKTADADIRAHVQARSHDQLVEMVMRLSDRDADVRRALVDEVALADGKFDELIRAARAELRSLTADPVWYDSWRSEGNVPEFDGLKRRFQTLLDHGYADAVVTLAEELITRGIDQVEQSHDEGETSMAIADCLELVQSALLKSSRSDEEKILFVIDATLKDEYGLCDGFCDLLELEWKKPTWSKVADRLQRRLSDLPTATKGSDRSSSYQRDRLSAEAIKALDQAGREDEATELSIDEARQCRTYPRAVQRLIDRRDIERAESLATEGLARTDPKLLGTIGELEDQLCKIAADRSDWSLPAAVAAERFFARPSVRSYQELLDLAKKAKCQPAVHAGAMQFLETGVRPDSTPPPSSRLRNQSAWPLPLPPTPKSPTKATARSRPGEGSCYSVLIDLAIHEKRPDDVLMWYDKRNALSARRSAPVLRRRYSRDDARIAEAIEITHPERAVDLYRRIAVAIAAETNTKTYPEVGRYLKRVQSLLRTLDRTADWQRLLADFRKDHDRKRRLMEVLDGMEGRPIGRRR